MDRFPPYLLLTVSIFITLTYTVIRNLYSKKHVLNESSYYSFNFWTGLCSTAVLLILSSGQLQSSWYSVLLGIVFGVITLLAALFNMKSLSIGPMAYTTVIVTSAMMIPALSGRLFWNESVAWYQYVGMVVMLLSMICAVDAKGGGKASVRWLVLCLLTFACSGAIGVLQKVHQTSVHGDESAVFLVTAFLSSAVISGLLYLKKRPKKATAADKKFSGAVLVMMLISGVFIALANQINLYLSGAMDSAIFFPVVNGVGMLLAALTGIVFFREKFTVKQWVGMGLGTAAVLLLCI